MDLMGTGRSIPSSTKKGATRSLTWTQVSVKSSCTILRRYLRIRLTGNTSIPSCLPTFQ
jgi:hypothetical protein